MAVSRRQVVLTGVAGACAAVLPSLAHTLDSDMTIGDPAAAVQLVEYASLTCPHCAAFHAEVFPRLKAEYVDTRRIGFTLREFPTAPAQVAVAMFQLARLGGAGPDVYFERVGVLFREQRAILSTGTGAGVRDALFALGASWGFSNDQVMAAVTDQAGFTRIQATVDDALSHFAIQGTPAFVLNNELLARGPSTATYEGLSAALNATLGV